MIDKKRTVMARSQEQRFCRAGLLGQWWIDTTVYYATNGEAVDRWPLLCR